MEELVEQPLFRGKVKYNGNHRFSGEWVYGTFHEIVGVPYIRETWVENSGMPDYNEGSKEFYEVVYDTVGVYTNFDDVDGKRVFVGDTILFEGYGMRGVGLVVLAPFGNDFKVEVEWSARRNLPIVSDFDELVSLVNYAGYDVHNFGYVEEEVYEQQD